MDEGLIDSLWRAPANARWIEPPEEGEIADAIARGHAFLWQVQGEVAGFAVLFSWVPRVMALKAIATTRPGQGELFLRAVLAHTFGPLAAHRIGFDVTADNSRALALYDRLGFRREGLIRECWRREDGTFVDCHLLGMLAREWQP
jgi:RimJ/RimL family protein N-acetyltransferase